MKERFRRVALLGTTALLVVVQAEMVRAQNGEFLGTIILGESKRDVQTDTAIPLTVVDNEEIDDRQAGTVAELVDSVPGVTLVNGSTPAGSGINIRGFGANSTFGTDQKVAVQIDGASVGSEELYRIGTQLFTDPFLFKEVQVIRGTVGSFEYGSGIVGGVVRLETKDASDFTLGEIGFAGAQTLAFASNGDGITSSSTLAWQPAQNLELLANYTWREQDAQNDGNGNIIGNSDFKLPSYLLKARYSFGTESLQYVSLTYSDTSASDRDVPYDTFNTTEGFFGRVDRETQSRTAILTYGNNPVGNDLIDLTVAVSYADQDIQQTAVPAATSALRNADHKYETTKLTFRNTSLFATGPLDHELRTGLEVIRKDRLTASSAPGGRDNRVAVFAVDEIRFGGWTVTPALRFETSDVKGSTPPDDGSYSNDALMGGVSVRYAFRNGIAVFGSAAYTENLPIIDDLNNPDYMTISEKAKVFEVGASYNRADLFADGDTFAIKANLYTNDLYDNTSYSSTLFGQSERSDRVKTEGIEIEASYAAENGLYADMNINIVDGEEIDQGQSVFWRNTPADSARLTLGKKFSEELDLSWEIVAQKGENNDAYTSGGFGVHNLRATYKPQVGVLKDTELRFGIENVFDRDYTPALSTRPAPGRNIKLTLTKLF